jgi:hypothetical protein
MVHVGQAEDVVSSCGVREIQADPIFVSVVDGHKHLALIRIQNQEILSRKIKTHMN